MVGTWYRYSTFKGNPIYILVDLHTSSMCDHCFSSSYSNIPIGIKNAAVIIISLSNDYNDFCVVPYVVCIHNFLMWYQVVCHGCSINSANQTSVYVFWS